MLTEAQWARVKAYAKLVNANQDLITSYKGDLVYDGALLATYDDPVIAILRDSGTHMLKDPSLVEATRKAFGSGGDNSIRYFLGENTPRGLSLPAWVPITPPVLFLKPRSRRTPHGEAPTSRSRKQTFKKEN